MSKTEFVGIVNVTPDSFSDGGNYLKENAAVSRANDLLNNGASIVDIGGESTRPGATPLEPNEEWSRIGGVLGELIPVYNESISVDTYHPEIVRRALQFGNFIVNDVTGFNNSEMQEVVAEHQLPCIVSHLPVSAGQDIQLAHERKEVDSVEQVVEDVEMRVDELITRGLSRSLITVDPGLGFGKTAKTNWELLRFAELTDLPVMIGHSNKRFLRTFPSTGKEPSILPKLEEKTGLESFMETANRQAAKIAIESGAKYLRVHEPALYANFVR